MLTRDFLASRHRIIPGQETGTLTRSAGGSPVTVGIEYRPITDKSVFASQVSGFAFSAELILHSTDAITAPLSGDTITRADATVWRVQDCREEILQTRFRCLVTKHAG